MVESNFHLCTVFKYNLKVLSNVCSTTLLREMWLKYMQEFSCNFIWHVSHEYINTSQTTFCMIGVRCWWRRPVTVTAANEPITESTWLLYKRRSFPPQSGVRHQGVSAFSWRLCVLSGRVCVCVWKGVDFLGDLALCFSPDPVTPLYRLRLISWVRPVSFSRVSGWLWRLHLLDTQRLFCCCRFMKVQFCFC